MSMIPIVASIADVPAAVRFAEGKPSARWYVARRARALGVPGAIPEDWGITAAGRKPIRKLKQALSGIGGGWDSSLHPRGRDGKFIEKGGVVDLFEGAGFSTPSARGEAIGLRAGDGGDIVTVRVTRAGTANGKPVAVGDEVEVAPDRIASVSKAKARLDETADPTDAMVEGTGERLRQGGSDPWFPAKGGFTSDPDQATDPDAARAQVAERRLETAGGPEDIAEPEELNSGPTEEEITDRMHEAARRYAAAKAAGDEDAEEAAQDEYYELDLDLDEVTEGSMSAVDIDDYVKNANFAPDADAPGEPDPVGDPGTPEDVGDVPAPLAPEEEAFEAPDEDAGPRPRGDVRTMIGIGVEDVGVGSEVNDGDLVTVRSVRNDSEVQVTNAALREALGGHLFDTGTVMDAGDDRLVTSLNHRNERDLWAVNDDGSVTHVAQVDGLWRMGDPVPGAESGAPDDADVDVAMARKSDEVWTTLSEMATQTSLGAADDDIEDAISELVAQDPDASAEAIADRVFDQFDLEEIGPGDSDGPDLDEMTAPATPAAGGPADRVRERFGDEIAEQFRVWEDAVRSEGGGDADVSRWVDLQLSTPPATHWRAADPEAARADGAAQIERYGTGFADNLWIYPIGDPRQPDFGGFQVWHANPDGSKNGGRGSFPDRESAQAFVDGYEEAFLAAQTRQNTDAADRMRAYAERSDQNPEALSRALADLDSEIAESGASGQFSDRMSQSRAQARRDALAQALAGRDQTQTDAPDWGNVVGLQTRIPATVDAVSPTVTIESVTSRPDGRLDVTGKLETGGSGSWVLGASDLPAPLPRGDGSGIPDYSDAQGYASSEWERAVADAGSDDAALALTNQRVKDLRNTAYAETDVARQEQMLEAASALDVKRNDEEMRLRRIADGEDLGGELVPEPELSETGRAAQNAVDAGQRAADRSPFRTLSTSARNKGVGGDDFDAELEAALDLEDPVESHKAMARLMTRAKLGGKQRKRYRELLDAYHGTDSETSDNTAAAEVASNLRDDNPVRERLAAKAIEFESYDPATGPNAEQREANARIMRGEGADAAVSRGLADRDYVERGDRTTGSSGARQSLADSLQALVDAGAASPADRRELARLEAVDELDSSDTGGTTLAVQDVVDSPDRPEDLETAELQRRIDLLANFLRGESEGSLGTYVWRSTRNRAGILRSEMLTRNGGDGSFLAPEPSARMRQGLRGEIANIDRRIASAERSGDTDAAARWRGERANVQRRLDRETPNRTNTRLTDPDEIAKNRQAMGLGGNRAVAGRSAQETTALERVAGKMSDSELRSAYAKQRRANANSPGTRALRAELDRRGVAPTIAKKAASPPFQARPSDVRTNVRTRQLPSRAPARAPSNPQEAIERLNGQLREQGGHYTAEELFRTRMDSVLEVLADPGSFNVTVKPPSGSEIAVSKEDARAILESMGVDVPAAGGAPLG